MSLINRVVVKCFLNVVPLMSMNEINKGRAVLNSLYPAPLSKNECTVDMILCTFVLHGSLFLS